MNLFQKNIPNILTILRLAVVPLFVFYMLNGQTYEAIIVFLAAEFTDVLDGIIARRFNLISDFGKVADPFADKLMQLAALFMLAEKQMIYCIVPWAVLLLDLFMVIGGIYVIKNKKKVDVSSKWFGKLTSALLFVTIMLTFFGAPRIVTDIMLIVCVTLALLSVIMYIRNYFRQVRRIGPDPQTTADK